MDVEAGIHPGAVIRRRLSQRLPIGHESHVNFKSRDSRQKHEPESNLNLLVEIEFPTTLHEIHADGQNGNDADHCQKDKIEHDRTAGGQETERLSQ